MAAEETTEKAESSGIYVYGIVPADVEAENDAVGVVDCGISTVKEGDIAALVSELSVDRPLGQPDDLRAHARVLDGTSRVAPVLPLRFGAVLTDTDAVKQELLSAHADEFAKALSELEGKAQYVVKGRYIEHAILREVIAENDEAARLRDAIRGTSEDATRDARMALGELVTNAISAKHDEDTRTTIDALADLSAAVNIREPTHEREAVQVALLVDVDRQEELEEAVGKLAEQWDGRVEMRLLGPLAPYDFVVSAAPGDEG